MTTAPTKIRVNVYVTPEQKEMFDDEAKRLGKTRSTLIAEAATRQIEKPSAPSNLPDGRFVVRDCVDDIARRYRGIPRVQLVGMVSAVISKLGSL